MSENVCVVCPNAHFTDLISSLSLGPMASTSEALGIACQVPKHGQHQSDTNKQAEKEKGQCQRFLTHGLAACLPKHDWLPVPALSLTSRGIELSLLPWLMLNISNLVVLDGLSILSKVYHFPIPKATITLSQLNTRFIPRGNKIHAAKGNNGHCRGSRWHDRMQ